jgi:putative transposase
VTDICRQVCISPASWKRKYEGMPPSGMRRLKQLEDDGAKPKKISRLSLEGELLQDLIRRTFRPARRRTPATWICKE